MLRITHAARAVANKNEMDNGYKEGSNQHCCLGGCQISAR